jgi:hypothetical protein
VKLLTTLLLLAAIVISLISSIPMLVGTYQLCELGFFDSSSRIEQLPIPGVLPINDDGLQRLRQKDFEGGLAVHYQFSLIPFLPILFLAVAFICDRRSLKTRLGKISVTTAAVLYVMAFTVLAWLYSWINLPQIGS